MLLRSIILTVALAAGATTAVAQPKAPAPAPAPKEVKPAKDEVPAADAEKFLAFFNQFADAVIQNKDNCPKMATSINAVIDANEDVIKKANEMKAANKKLPKAIEDKMTARLKDMFPAMVKCKDDAAVKTAMKRMEGPSKKSVSKPKATQ